MQTELTANLLSIYTCPLAILLNCWLSLEGPKESQNMNSAVSGKMLG
jgi:hypothetical protein